jgi:uncharacterized protein YegL
MGIAKPGTAGIATRDMHFFWIVDCSGSMQIDGKMAQVNNAIKESIEDMRRVADENPFAKMQVRVLTFSNGANWHVSQPTAVSDFGWSDLQADGVTDMGAAFEKLAEQLDVNKLGQHGFPPVLVLISDGQPTDDWKKPLKKVLDSNWGKRAARVAIAIGKDADKETLKAFVNNPEIPVLEANNPQMLTKYIKWVSAQVSQAVVAPPSKTAEQSPSDAQGALAAAVPPPLPSTKGDDDLVW